MTRGTGHRHQGLSAGPTTAQGTGFKVRGVEASLKHVVYVVEREGQKGRVRGQTVGENG